MDRQHDDRSRSLAPTRSGTFPVGQPRLPTAGVDYPRSEQEFARLFGSEAACQQAVERLRWPRGWICPHCGSAGAPFRAGRLLGCSACGRVSAITSNTALRGTITPLQQWFRALWEVASHESGTNPAAIQRALGLPNEHGAWEILARVRSGICAATRDRLRGEVEIARCLIEVEPGGTTGRTEGSPLVVVVAAQRCSGRLGRVRLRILAPLSSRAMLEFVTDSVAPGTTILTGGWPGYASLAAAGYRHERTTRPTDGTGHERALPEAQHVADVLRLWIWGTRVVTRERLAHYLDEFVFRFERRGCAPGLLFYHLLRATIPVERARSARVPRPTGQAAAG